mgnify:CR=1 FL=1
MKENIENECRMLLGAGAGTSNRGLVSNSVKRYGAGAGFTPKTMRAVKQLGRSAKGRSYLASLGVKA